MQPLHLAWQQSTSATSGAKGGVFDGSTFGTGDWNVTFQSSDTGNLNASASSTPVSQTATKYLLWAVVGLAALWIIKRKQ